MKIKENAQDDNQERHNGLGKMSYKSKNMQGNREGQASGRYQADGKA
jgi:hypothetical protein